MAIEAGDFKTGLTVMVDGDPWQVIDFMHVKPGKCSNSENKDEELENRFYTGKKL